MDRWSAWTVSNVTCMQTDRLRYRLLTRCHSITMCIAANYVWVRYLHVAPNVTALVVNCDVREPNNLLKLAFTCVAMLLDVLKPKFHLTRHVTHRHDTTRSTCRARQDERVEPCCCTSSTQPNACCDVTWSAKWNLGFILCSGMSSALFNFIFSLFSL